MGMSAGGGGSNVEARPNVVPMIDIMLVLLIIFMVVAPALMAGFNATPPEGINLKDHPEDEQTDQVLGIDRDGQYYLNKKPIKNEDLPQMLRQIYDSRTEDKIMYLKADRTLNYAKVLDAIDIASKNGVRVVGMISDQRQGTVSTVAGDTRAPQATLGGPARSGGTP
ncbi:MAG TPA: biopolymer transporter ExbD [Gemmatimonadaceae bacterium]|nr:biopolymer transporter ExbD [Gemmatimonadaceae bacterium]